MMPPALMEWLRIATRPLALAARQRFVEEIQAHYADAVQRYLAQGCSIQEAQQRALADLGLPEEVARHLRRAYGWRAGLAWLRGPSAGRATALLLLALAALYGAQRLAGLSPSTDIGPITATALLMQVTALVVALLIPLAFDDLDLSAGMLVMLGALVARSTGAPVELGRALLLAGALGVALGLAHGLSAIMLRVPVARVTLLSGALLAAGLGFFPQIHNLGLASAERLTLLGPSLLLLLAALLLAGLAALGAALLRPAGAATPPVQAPESWGLGGWLSRLLLLAPLVYLLYCLASITHGWQQAWSDPLAFLSIVARRLVDSPEPLIGLLATAISSLIILVLAHALRSSTPRHWLQRSTALAAQPRRLLLARLAALVISSTLAALVGVLTGAQGIRDGTYAASSGFYVLVPLAALVVGGVPWLSGWQRGMGGLLGGLATAGLLIPGSGDNLLPSAIAAVALAALMALRWRALARRQQAGGYGPLPELQQAETEPSHMLMQRG